MIKAYTLIRVDCDYCDESYPSKKDVIHFQNEEAANKTVKENGWTMLGERHACPACAKIFREADKIISSMFENRADEN